MRSRRRALFLVLAAVATSVAVPVGVLAHRASEAASLVVHARARLTVPFEEAATVERLDARGAIADLDQALALVGDDEERSALAHLARSIEDLQAGDLILADGELAAARASLPPEPTLDVVAAAIAARRADLPAARESARHALTLDPTEGRAQLLLASLDLDEGALDEARETLDALCAAHDASAEPHRVRGLVRERVGDLAGAEEELRRAVVLDTRDDAAHIGLGELLRRSGRTHAAVLEFDAALRQGESSAEAHLGRGLALVALGDDAGADVDLRRAAELAPRDATPWLALGDVAAHAGRLDDAIDLYRHGLGIDANDAAGFVKLGNALVRHGDPRDAATAFRSAILLSASLGAAHGGLGVALLALGDTASARAELNRAVVLDPTDAHPRAALALLDRRTL